jgi:putative flippase GtrA
LFRFGAVGLGATLVHFLVAVGAVQFGKLAPQLANVLGFGVAFCVSFLGQWRWTFLQRVSVPVARALPLYLMVSIGGFAANALAYEWLLTHTAWRYDVALAVVLVAVASMTFALSRYWVFRPRAHRPRPPR